MTANIYSEIIIPSGHIIREVYNSSIDNCNISLSTSNIQKLSTGSMSIASSNLSIEVRTPDSIASPIDTSTDFCQLTIFLSSSDSIEASIQPTVVNNNVIVNTKDSSVITSLNLGVVSTPVELTLWDRWYATEGTDLYIYRSYSEFLPLVSENILDLTWN